MKFLDSNVFIYAYYKPKRMLSPEERKIKDMAKEIISSISLGKDEVTTTIVHLSEIVNVLKYGMSINELTDLIMSLFMLNNVKIFDVSRSLYFAAIELAREWSIDPNDALAVEVMWNSGIREIYSFDKVFDRVKGIVRLPKI